MVELCDCEDSKERIIRDVLIVGCTSTQAKDKIIRKGEKVTLKEVLEILQIRLYIQDSADYRFYHQKCSLC